MRPPLPAVVFLALIASVVSAAAQPLMLNFKLGLDWSAVSRVEKRGNVSVEYLRQGDDRAHPKERFAYQNGFLRGKQTPEDELNTLKADAKKRGPDATKWNVIAVDDTSLLYESQSKQCANEPDNHVIARVLHGRHNFFALIYVAIGQYVDPGTRTKWIGILQDASVDSDARDAKSMGAEDVDDVIPFP